jgi:LacI family transcriptional regulator
MTTILDVAERAGVSPSTVSHVLNKTRHVSEKTRARVLQAVDELNYRPNILARSLRRRETHTLGILIPDNTNPFFAEMVRGIEDTVFDEGYTVLLGNSDGEPDKELRYLDLFVNKQVDGVVLVAAAMKSDETMDVLSDPSVATVIVDREIELERMDMVLADNLEGGYAATRHLLELGHRRIGCIAGPSQVTPSAERVIGYHKALEEWEITPDPALVIPGDFRHASGLRAAKHLLALSEPPTAIFACNDMMALGVLSAANELEISVPDELSLIGFDDIALDELVVPRLTTICQPAYEMGCRAATLLLERLQDPDRAVERQVLETYLVKRDSTAPLRTGA